MTLTKTLKLLFPLLVLSVSTAFAQPNVTVNIKAEKETIKEIDGEKVTTRVNAENIEPGDVIYYTLTITNQGKELAKNLKLDDPIPENTAYIAGSAFGDGTTILFSIDGKTFKKPTLLTYVVKNAKGESKEKVASPEEYTQIRWILDQLPAGQTMTAGFNVKVL